MSKFLYVTFVVCKMEDDKNYLFYAPPFTVFKENEIIVVNTKYGERPASVVTYCIAESGSDTEKALRKLCNAKGKLQKVLGRVRYVAFEYEGEDDDE